MGWYVADGDTKAIYLLGPDHVKSLVRSEVILHELLHSILVDVVDASNPSFASQQLILELQGLLNDARNYVQSNNLPQYQRATQNLHELIAYGMLNQDFQKNVLEKLTVTDPKTKNELVNQTGLKRFVTSVIKFLGFTQSGEKVAENGLVTLIRDVSGLLEEAKARPASRIKTVLSMAAPDVNSYSTQTLYAGLSGNVSEAFDFQLQGLLQGIVDKLHGPFGSFKAERMEHQALMPTDIFLKALAEGVAPFASLSLAAGFKISEKEAFVLEQVEATVRAALTDNAGQTTVAYRELSKLYAETYQRLKPQDFHQGEWSQATAEEQRQAQALYDFLFKLERTHGDSLDYLSRFAALGLANEQVNSLLKTATARDTRTLAQLPLQERLQAVFERILSWLNGKLTKTYAGQRGDDKLQTLVDQLVSIEAKKRSKLLQQQSGSVFDTMERRMTGTTQGIKAGIARLAESSVIQKSSNTFVRLLGKLASTAARDRLEHYLQTVEKFRNEHTQEGLDVVSGIVNEMRGAKEDNRTLFRLHREAKRREGVREDIESGTTQTVLEGYANSGKDLTDADQKAITNFYLRTDASVLLDSMSMTDLATLLQSDAAIAKKASDIEKQLLQYGRYANFYSVEAKALGYFLATGRATTTHLLKNAEAIARMVGTSYQDQLGREQRAEATKLIDQLATLRAMQYTSGADKQKARNVLATEMRRGAENGVELTLKLHKNLNAQAKDRLFYSDSLLVMKGYTPEIYNPHKEVRVADEVTGAELVSQGFTQGGQVPHDDADPDKGTVRHLYYREGGGLAPYLTGTFSLQDLKAKGSRSASNSVADMAEWVANKQDLKVMQMRKQGDAANLFRPNPNFDPSKVDATYAVPVLDWEGNITDYNYLMSAAMKDSALLDRDNRFAALLGRQAANQFDKQTTPEQNRKVIEALKAQYDAEYSERSAEYRVIGPNSPIAAHRQMYQMLPHYAKESIAVVWGEEGMRVRVDLLDLVFGYRKPSVSDVFNKDETLRNAGEQIFVDVATQLLGAKAMLYLNRFDEVWQLIVKEIKDIYVIKNLKTLMGNIKSNLSELAMFGVPLTDMVRDHRIALKGALAYRQDAEELASLRMRLESGYVQGNEAQMKRDILILEDRLAKNPVRELIEAGMMPTIVEDIDQEDIYSYKAWAQKQLDTVASKVSPRVREAA